MVCIKENNRPFKKLLHKKLLYQPIEFKSVSVMLFYNRFLPIKFISKILLLKLLERSHFLSVFKADITEMLCKFFLYILDYDVKSNFCVENQVFLLFNIVQRIMRDS